MTPQTDKAESPYTILAVDDEPFNLEALERTFRGQYRVLSATSGQQALELLKENSIQLIIADQRMPGMSGIELLEKARKISPDAIRMVLTAYTDVEYLMDAINRGEVYRYITKPWEPQELRMIVQNAVQYYESQQAQKRLLKELQEQNVQLQKTLTQLKEAQQKIIQMERLALIGRMASLIIHDLKQPLDIIQSTVDTMLEFDLTEKEKHEFSQIVNFEISRFTEMIQEILEFTRGEMSLQFDTLDLKELFTIIDEENRKFLVKYPIAYYSYFRGDSISVQVDVRRFQRAIYNLIKNAAEATLEIETERLPEIIFEVKNTGKEARFVVRDNGPGIPEGLQKQLFEPFITVNKKSGIGLGLSIVKKIVEEHRGKISFISKEGKGTEFVISLAAKQKMKSRKKVKKVD